MKKFFTIMIACSATVALCSCSGDKGSGTADSAGGAADSLAWAVTADSATADSTPVVEEEQEEEAAAYDEKEINLRVQKIWKHLPIMETSTNGYITPELVNIFNRAAARAEKNGPDDIGDSECVYGWFGVGDYDENGKVTVTKIDPQPDGSLKATVRYNFLPGNPPITYKIVLVKQGGEWLLDDFEGMKAKLRRYVKTGVPPC